MEFETAQVLRNEALGTKIGNKMTNVNFVVNYIFEETHSHNSKRPRRLQM